MRSSDQATPQYLEWLAASVRNFGVALSPPPGPFPTDSPIQPETIHALDSAVEYEPRALAISPCGNRIAVGTKSGWVHIWTWGGPPGPGRTARQEPIPGGGATSAADEAAGWVETRWIASSVGGSSMPPAPPGHDPVTYETTRDAKHARHRAVRALGFLDAQTLIVCGGVSPTGHGTSSAVNKAGGGDCESERSLFVLTLPPPKSQPTQDDPIRWPVFKCAPAASAKQAQPQPQSPAWLPHEVRSHYPSGFFDRARAIVSLVPPARVLPSQPGKEGDGFSGYMEQTAARAQRPELGIRLPVALILSNGLDVVRLDAVHKDGTTDFYATHGVAGDFVDFPKNAPTSRVVGGVWWRRDSLWLLGRRGRLHQVRADSILPVCATDSLTRVETTTEASESSGLVPNSPVSEFDDLRASWDCLAIRAGSYFALLRAQHPPDAAPDAVRPVYEGATWLKLEHALDFMVFRPFVRVDQGADDPTRSSPPTKGEPVWLLATSNGPRVYWTAWHADGGPKRKNLDASATADNPDTEPAAASGTVAQLKPHVQLMAPLTQSSVEGEVLVLAHGAIDPPPRPMGTTPCYFVAGTRGHRVRISSFVHYTNAVAELLRRTRGDSLPFHSSQPQSQAGLRLWSLFRQMTFEFGLRPHAIILTDRWRTLPSDCQDTSDWCLDSGSPSSTTATPLTGIERLPDAVVAVTDASDLFALAGFLGRMLTLSTRSRPTVAPQTSPAALNYLQHKWGSGSNDDGSRRAAIEAAERWCYFLLTRAAELDGPNYPLRTQVATEIASSLQRVARGRFQHFALLAEIIRKWVRFGSTYDAKDFQIFRLAHWNLLGRRDLDAAKYLLRLVGRPLEREWDSSIPEPSPNNAVWALANATGVAEQFTIQAHHDGRVTALDALGREIAWRDDLQAIGTVEGLALSPDGSALQRSDHASFVSRYRTGPYARALYVSDVEEETHVVVFSLKGWRVYDMESDETRKPLVVALLVQYSADRRVLELLACATYRAPTELYALCCERDTDETVRQSRGRGRWVRRRSHILLAGTRGTKVRLSEGEDPHPHEFVRLRLVITKAPSGWVFAEAISIEAAASIAPADSLMRVGSEPEFPYRPTTAMASLCSADGANGVGPDLLWVGRQDGKLLLYRRSAPGAPSECWSPGAVFDCGEQVTCLDAWRPAPGSASFFRDGFALVAYATAGGVVGVLAWRLPVPDEPTARVLAVPIHLLHTTARSPIVGLHSFDASRPEDGWGSQRLMAVAKSGRAFLYDVALGERRSPGGEGSQDDQGDPKKPNASESAAARFRRATAHRRGIAGTRTERLRIGESVRSSALVTSPSALESGALDADRLDLEHFLGEKGRGIPTLYVGTSRGQVVRYRLALPRLSKRRSRAMDIVSELLVGPSGTGENLTDRCLANRFGIQAAVGPDRYWSWLQMQDGGNLEILRYSLWQVLETAGKTVLQWAERWEGTAEPLPTPMPMQVFYDYLDVVHRSGDEAERRRHLSREPVKLIWDRASKVASKLALESILAHATGRDDAAALLLKCYFDLVRALDVLTNRWSGMEGESESTALMHSFQSLFDWHCVVLLMTRPTPVPEPDPRPAPEEGPRRFPEQLKQVHQQLLRRLCQERLFHSDPLVAAEALRVVNLAALRVIDLRRNDAFAAGDGVAAYYTDTVLSRDGFFTLVTQVASFASQAHGRVGHDAPLFTEVAKFFGLCLLLYPESALVIGRFVSEWKLASLSPRIADHARLLLEQVESELAPPHAAGPSPGAAKSSKGHRASDAAPTFRSTREAAIQNFHGYREGRHATDDELRAARTDSTHEAATYSDAQFAAQQRALQPWIAALNGLDPNSPPSFKPFAADAGEEHFRESQRCLRQLHELVARARAFIHGESTDLGESSANLAATASHLWAQARGIIQDSGVVDPQAETYRAIVAKWEEDYRRTHQGAAQYLRTLDNYSRHVYQGATDELMGDVHFAVGRLRPFLPQLQDRSLSLRAALRDHVREEPILRGLVESTYRVSDYGFLQSALLRLVTAAESGARGPARSDTVRAFDLHALAQRVGRYHGLSVKFIGEAALWHPTPESGPQPAAAAQKAIFGSEYIWEAILYEFSANIAKELSRVRDERQAPAETDATLFIWSANARATGVPQVLLCGGPVGGAPPNHKPGGGREMIRALCRAAEIEPLERLYTIPSRALEPDTGQQVEQWEKRDSRDGRLGLAMRRPSESERS
jgi:hypothetical protein